MTRSSFRTRLWLGFGLMGIAIVALGWVALSSTHRLARASDWIRAASAHQATARRVGVAARDWATLLERAAVGEPVTPQALDETQRAVERAIDEFERAAAEPAAEPLADGPDPGSAEERVAELQLMAARLALIAGRLDGQGLNEGDREQMAALGRRFGDVAAEAEAQGAREVERAREVATDTAGLASAVILAITAGSLALAVVVSALLSRRLARSVTTLLDATKRMSSGDLDVRTTLGGNDEFSALARGFTRMSADLNRNIEQRKRESAKAKQLAREAGVAYVTTGVIHNIGNALTSVNISLELLQSSGVGERLARVARVGSMLAEHQDELDHFLLHDPKGSRVAQYLVALAPELERDAEGFEDELGRVRERVDHLVHILRAYQAHGMATLDYEDARVDELLEFAVDVALSSGRQTRYRVVCKVDGLSVIRIDKHRTLQILINLVRNAADAIDQSRRSDGEIVVAAHPVESTMVGFAVTDNGVGIESEHFDQIFLHGFTTKPANTGSGFGLHASANAAAEMGGRLLAHSDGPDKGAHFVLEIPFKEALGDGVEDQDDARSPPDA